MRNFLGTLMRYFLFPVARLADRQLESPVAGPLIITDRLGHLFSAGGVAARPTTVPIAAIAKAAQEEDLTASVADDESK